MQVIGQFEQGVGFSCVTDGAGAYPAGTAGKEKDKRQKEKGKNSNYKPCPLSLVPCAFYLIHE
ncbi:MAG TPA: hypothetical protein DFI01_06745 [Bacteroidales bacterium]|nr:hypothetical protein [Bacteroidales bacterium]